MSLCFNFFSFEMEKMKNKNLTKLLCHLQKISICNNVEPCLEHRRVKCWLLSWSCRVDSSHPNSNPGLQSRGLKSYTPTQGCSLCLLHSPFLA